MDARDARVPDTIDSIAHRFGSQRSFFRDRDVARDGGHDRDRADALVGFVATNSDQACRLVPLGVCNYVANLAERAFVSASDEDVRRTRREPVDDADDLRARLAAAKNDLRKAVARRACVVDARKTDVFKVKILDAVYRVVSFQLTAFVGGQQLRQFVEIHRQKHATKKQTKHITENTAE